MPNPQSKFKELLEGNIKELLRKQRPETERHIPWFHREEVMPAISYTLHKRGTSVTIDNRKFTIRYLDDRAIIAPEDGLVPRANIDVAAFQREVANVKAARKITRLDGT